MTLPQQIHDAIQSDVTLAFAEELGALAQQALIAEAELTPKPGLVDHRGSGSHSDLSLDLMRRSAEAIAPYFAEMAFASASTPMNPTLRAAVGEIGRRAEAAMFRATSGSNAHRGAIWTLGLLVCAASQSPNFSPETIAEKAGYLARLPDRARPRAVSHGDLVLDRFGAIGARGEACANFPHVVNVGLPALKKARRDCRSERNSRLAALLAIMSQLEDTCVLYRGGKEALQFVQEGAASVLDGGGPGDRHGDERLIALGNEFVSRRISPGGSADLLAATLFLDALERGISQVEKDNSYWEENHGEDRAHLSGGQATRHEESTRRRSRIR